ncbi:MAG: flagellar biosynthesis protein FlhA [Gammaproteobacteria bacterium]|nr:MAG: flagellar biosynthesis protein FlhA [Gammaproteobacteria bacterium]
MADAATAGSLKEQIVKGMAAPILVIALLGMVIIPLPPIMLDVMFTFNIALSLVVLLVTVYVIRPLEFSVFPTVLLVATLLRLAMNVASTRVVLLRGHTGPGAAGNVIEAFGEFVIGGNYAVGLVVFMILVIINFVVVTKGAGRISEVSARFTLDALPGKQMAIDADLNAGLIDQDEAKARRQDVGQEADFYGAMDGASKFVRGDAVAGIMILVINIVGGLSVGILQHNLSFSDAMQFYILLTIGDGLVAQIPGLVISTSAAMLVTRVSKTEQMGKQVIGQMFTDPKALYITAGILGIMGIVPGMPNIPFLFLAAICGGGGYYMGQRKIEIDEQKQVEERREQQVAQEQALAEAPRPENKELSWEDVPAVDLLSLEVGYGLIPMVDKNQGGQLLDRIKGVRKKLSQELGFLVQAVHIRDNLDLRPNEYRISVLGVPVGEAEVQPGQDMAINPGSVRSQLAGEATKDPAFGLEAVWVDPSKRDYAQTLGYTVVDISTVIATHLSQIIQDNAYQLLGHDETQKMLDMLAEKSPKLVEELVPNTLPLSVVVRVLQNLLEEKVQIRDFRTIVETLAENGRRSQDPVALTGVVRESLGRMIVQNVCGMSQEMPVITLDPKLEQILLNSVHGAGEEGVGFEPGLAQRLHSSLEESVQRQEMAGDPAVLLISPQLRSWLSRMTRHSMPALHVLAYNEIPDNKQVKVVASIGQEQIAEG